MAYGAIDWGPINEWVRSLVDPVTPLAILSLENNNHHSWVFANYWEILIKVFKEREKMNQSFVSSPLLPIISKTLRIWLLQWKQVPSSTEPSDLIMDFHHGTGHKVRIYDAYISMDDNTPRFACNSGTLSPWNLFPYREAERFLWSLNYLSLVCRLP